MKLTPGVQTSLAGKLTLAITDTGIDVTAVDGWTGRVAFPVIATVDAKQVELFVGVEEDPTAATSSVFTLIDTSSTQVNWVASKSQVMLYNVYLGSKLACSTNKTSCSFPIDSINNFKSHLMIEAVGHQATLSTKVTPAYRASHIVTAGLVHFKTNSSVLSQDDKSNLDTLVSTFKQLGISVFLVNGHTDSTGPEALNHALSAARANVVKAYISKLMPSASFNADALSSSFPVSSNKTADGRSDNRRAEIFVG